jgi:predicted RNA polymerase sigma factor
LFNEGYHSTTNNTYLRKELCLEAMQLNYFLLENNSTNKPSVNALMSLMCFHASRFDSRLTKDGDPVLYDDQNKEFWDDELIQKGNYYLIESAKGNEISKYHLRGLHCLLA